MPITKRYLLPFGNAAALDWILTHTCYQKEAGTFWLEVVDLVDPFGVIDKRISNMLDFEN